MPEEVYLELSEEPVPKAGSEKLPFRAPSADFFVDLKIIYQQLGIRDPEEYLSDLAARFEVNRCWVTERRLRFHTDLKNVYSEIAPPASEQHLHTLAQHFDSWRHRTRLRMKEYMAGLPEDDPLRCPISLFGAIHYGRLEIAHTHVLAWLLNPFKEHGFEATLLKALLAHLCRPSILSSVQLEKIQSEYPIDNGRIDVVAQGKSKGQEGSWDDWLLVIEAKVDANEGEQQLRKYDKWIRKNRHGRAVFRVFLTAEGRKPETSDEEWMPMSFLHLACIFRAVYKSLEHQPGYHFLRYYLTGVLKDVCRWSLPVRDSASCEDPYSFVEYLKAVYASIRKGPVHDTTR